MNPQYGLGAGRFAQSMLNTPGYRPGPRESQNVIDRRAAASMTPFGFDLISMLKAMKADMMGHPAPQPMPQIAPVPQGLPDPVKSQDRLGY